MEREEKYLAFKKADMESNHGLIVNQFKEVAAIMEEPKLTEGFREGYLTNLLTHATRHSAFYKPYESFKSIQDFPLVNKEILKEHWDEVLVPEFKGRNDNKEKRTSGSTGTPFVVMWDRRKHSRMIADIKYFARMGGCESHERIVCMVVKGKMVPPKDKMERDNVYTIQYEYLDDSSIEKLLGEAEAYNPKMMISYSSMWDAVANYVYDGKAREYNFQLSSIMAEAEGLKERTRRILEEFFHCPMYSRYGNEECGTMAQEDGSGYGHRVNNASYYIEVLDMERNEPAKDGEIGRVVITDLFNYAFPLIRYENGDLAVRKKLEDGRVYLSSVVGRKVDILYTTEGKMVNWERALIFMNQFMDIRQFQIIQETETKFTWVLNTENHEYEDIIVKESKEVFGEDSEYEFKYVNEIPKLRSGKTQMTICKLNK